jgi:two-component system, chemotaxis family, CheB/CheR fusion protein
LLLVDDEPDTLQTFAALLSLEGGRPTLAHSGEEALRLAAEQPFDLLVSDLAMPGMDGYTLIGRMREAGHTLPAVAVAVSGMGRQSDRKRALEAGFTELVSKPVEMDALLGVIASLRQGG